MWAKVCGMTWTRAGWIVGVGIVACVSWVTRTVAEDVAQAQPLPAAFVPVELRGFDGLTGRVRAVIERASELSRMRLGYRYGSCDPAAGGMDCSGTIHRLLRDLGFADAPRQSDGIYRWVWERSRMYPVVSHSIESFELGALQPGDLLFWTGTYKVDREVPITHVMLYLGVRDSDGRRVMFGASDGRTSNGVSSFGVGAFDFVLPKPSPDGGGSRFVGYGLIPGIRESVSP